MPAVGYGIRYEFGIFKQAFADGQQIELPDDWTFYGNPWEFPAPDDLQLVGFYGHTEPVDDDQGGLRARWLPAEMVRGEPSHMLVPGYGTETVNILRLWRARAGRESFDLGLFNAGRYAEAVEAQMRSENLTKVLYPSDSTEAGRELRLKQQYFLVSCSLRDIIRRFRFRNSDWEAFPDKVAIQLNDTHPAIGVAELMRLLVDEHGLGWDKAWDITRRTFAYTNHTLLPEALETLAGAAVRARCCPATWRSSTRSTAASSTRCAPGFPGDDERVAPDVADRRGRRADTCAWRTSPSSAATPSTASPRCTRELLKTRRAARLLRAVAGEVQQQDQRRHAAPLARRWPTRGCPRLITAQSATAG